jgi:hypothetical protein
MYRGGRCWLVNRLCSSPFLAAACLQVFVCKFFAVEEINMSFGFKALLARPWLSLALAALILLTRTHHFGTQFSPPDATLAAFFLAGLFIPSAALFGGLLAVAALADQVAFAQGVSAWCVTAAYVFLVPTYGVMWYAGSRCRNTEFLTAAGASKLVAILATSGALAWVISSGSFFLFSGYFTDMSAIEYLSKVMRYIPPYIGWAAAYSIGGVAIAMLWRATRPADRASLAQH